MSKEFNPNDVDWLDIEPGEKILTFKESGITYVDFLDNGHKGETDITVKDRKSGEIITKTVPCVNFKVSVKGEEMSFNPISKKLIGDLQGLLPLKDPKHQIRIEFIKGRSDVENVYRVEKTKK